MLRLCIILNLFLLQLYACEGDYQGCLKKINDSKSIQNSLLSIPLENNKRIVYTKDIPNAVILKHDPFLSLYLVQDKNLFKYPFTFNMKPQPFTALIDNKKIIEGKFLQREIGLNTFASYTNRTTKTALVMSKCCALEGVNTSRGIIEKEYLKRFAASKTSNYGDIGVRLIDEKGFVIVSASDPFMKNNPFKRGDCIVAFNGEKVKSASRLMQKILFSKIQSKNSVKVKRDDKFHTFKVVTDKRYGGGYISDTFLERKGIYFDKTLHIVKLEKEFENYGLKVGDRLLKLNAVKLNNQEQLRLYLENFKDYSMMLFERDNFQFFVKIK